MLEEYMFVLCLYICGIILGSMVDSNRNILQGVKKKYKYLNGLPDNIVFQSKASTKQSRFGSVQFVTHQKVVDGTKMYCYPLMVVFQFGRMRVGDVV